MKDIFREWGNDKKDLLNMDQLYFGCQACDVYLSYFQIYIACDGV